MALPRQLALLQGSKWTSAAVLEGWRHFEVVGLRRGEAGWEVELAASCDARRRVTVAARALTKGPDWSAGWTTLRTLQSDEP